MTILKLFSVISIEKFYYDISSAIGKLDKLMSGVNSNNEFYLGVDFSSRVFAISVSFLVPLNS